MDNFYTTWQAAHAAAADKATRLNLDVALRAVKWYGKRGFTVTLASRNDSDYARAEIIRPGSP
jgi:hypothetical protein